MSETKVRRRGFGEDGIYFDAARNRYMGAVSLGYGPDGKRIRRKVSGKTKQEVRAKLQALHKEMSAGVKSWPIWQEIQNAGVNPQVPGARASPGGSNSSSRSRPAPAGMCP